MTDRLTYDYQPKYNVFRATDAMEFTRAYDAVMAELRDQSKHRMLPASDPAIREAAITYAKRKMKDLNERIDKIVADDPEKLNSYLLAALRGYEQAVIGINEMENRAFQFGEVMLWQDERAYRDARGF